MGSLDGKVAVISGAARGQGRSHAIKLAEEGADIIALDICAGFATIPYPPATEADLEETKDAVEATGARIFTSVTDVRDAEATGAAIRAGVTALGRHVDIVVANAGIAGWAAVEDIGPDVWDETISVNLTGVWNVISAALPSLLENGDGGSIVITSSAAAQRGVAHLAHYSAAKAGLIGLMQSLAVELAPQMIRVNTIHPTSVNTTMIHNESLYMLMSGGTTSDVNQENPPAAVVEALTGLNAMPVKWVEPVDISNAVLYLVSDTGRFVSGMQLRVDAGATA